ncbi:MAG: SusD/RagB family nutrient-binding outer membrane lipoprotein [Marinilabiliales bacterium]|nr:MAG: SusD/RagB family nutrient-binding outer membrane lipoprotein [Marinilabiliales bacterium]
MKIIKYLLVTLTVILAVTQCKLPDNVNPKRATEVPVETLLTNGLQAYFYQIDRTNDNTNTCRLYVQYFQQATYFDESRYLMQDRQIPDGFITEVYRDALMDFKQAKDIVMSDDLGDPDGQANRAAVLDILMAQGFLTCVDLFGNLPYTEALQLNDATQPTYDDAATIYQSELTNLANAIESFRPGSGWGGADILYGGDNNLWKKYGASLLLRYGMRLADVNPDLSKTAVATALAVGVFTSQEEAAFLHWVGVVPNVNPIYTAFVVDGRKDYMPTNTIVDIMANHDDANHDLGGVDPRLDNYFTTVEGQQRPYEGAVAGLDGAQTYALFSHFQDEFFEASFPSMLCDYVETEFFLAEAAQRGGYGVSGTAEEHYNNAITASILYWHGTQEEADAYLALPGVAYDAAKWKERIGVQKWIAQFNRGVEGWTEWKRLDYPMLNVPEGFVYGDIPLRYVYPYNEVLQNKANYEAAAAAIGGDYTYTPIFWDVVPTPFN